MPFVDECDFRLNPSGNIRVPPEATDFFYSGPCLIETPILLECIDNMLSNFIFYNKATVQQMRYALNSGCNYYRQRGHGTADLIFSRHYNALP